MKLVEVSATYKEPPSVEYALMTLDQFRQMRNPTGREFKKFNNYTDSISTMNTDRSVSVFYDKPNSPHDYIVNGTRYLLYKGKTVAKITNEILYTNTNHLSEIIKLDDIEFSAMRRVKRIATPMPNEVKNQFKLVQRVNFNGKPVEIRQHSRGYLAMYKNFVVGYTEIAEHKKGTSLVIADEFRGAKLTEILSDIHYADYVDVESGGFTKEGETNSDRAWARRVKKWLAAGWYSDLIKQGKLRKDRLVEILSGLNEIDNTRGAKSTMYIAYREGEVVAFDGRAFDDRGFVDPRYILAYTQILTTNGVAIVNDLLSRSAKYDKLAMRMLLQSVRDHGVKLDVQSSFQPQIVTDWFTDSVEIKDGLLKVTKDVIDFDQYQFHGLDADAFSSLAMNADDYLHNPSFVE